MSEAVGLGLGSRQGIGKPEESAGINEAVVGVTMSTRNENRPKLIRMRYVGGNPNKAAEGTPQST